MDIQDGIKHTYTSFSASFTATGRLPESCPRCGRGATLAPPLLHRLSRNTLHRGKRWTAVHKHTQMDTHTHCGSSMHESRALEGPCCFKIPSTEVILTESTHTPAAMPKKDESYKTMCVLRNLMYTRSRCQAPGTHCFSHTL